jgi:TATA-box binding protein (TBP) (component of TFIID and TFIIIB)
MPIFDGVTDMMFDIKNIKLSLKIQPLDLNSVVSYLSTNKTIIIEKKGNCVIIRNRYGYVYTIFISNNKVFSHINITGISLPTFIDHAIDWIKVVLKPSFTVVEIARCINNITASYTFCRKLNLCHLITNLQTNYKISMNREKFPGAVVTFNNGIVILFHSGKVITVGCKSIDNLKNLYKEMTSILADDGGEITNTCTTGSILFTPQNV